MKCIKGLLVLPLVLLVCKINFGQISLHQLVADKKYEEIEYFLVKHPDSINCVDKINRTALYASASMNDTISFNQLLEYFPDVNIADALGQTALHIAVTRKNEYMVGKLIERGVDVNFQSNKGHSALHLSCWGGMEKITELLINSGADINLRDITWLSPLHFAVDTSNEFIIGLLLADTIDINAQDNMGLTPLMYALTSEPNYQIAEMLIEKGADISLQDFGGNSCLHNAILISDYNLLKYILKYKPNVNCQNNAGDTPLMFACYKRDFLASTILIQSGADVNIPDDKGVVPIQLSIILKDKYLFNYFLTSGANLNVQDNLGFCLLDEAVIHNETDIFKTLVDSGAKINGTSTFFGIAPTIHNVINYGNLEQLEYLIQNRQDVVLNVRNIAGESALYFALFNKNMSVANLLIENSNELINATDKSNSTILHLLCTDSSYMQQIEWLIENDADIDPINNYFCTPLNFAVALGNKKISQFLIEEGASVNTDISKCIMPLYHTCEFEQNDITKLLVEKGADVNRTGVNKKAPLHISAKNGNIEILKYLLKKTKDVNILDDSLNTPLHYAVKNNRVDVVKILLNRKVDVNIKNYFGNTPIHLACKNGNIEIIRLLLKKGVNLGQKNKIDLCPIDFALYHGKFRAYYFLKQISDNKLRTTSDMISESNLLNYYTHFDDSLSEIFKNVLLYDSLMELNNGGKQVSESMYSNLYGAFLNKHISINGFYFEFLTDYYFFLKENNFEPEIILPIIDELLEFENSLITDEFVRNRFLSKTPNNLYIISELYKSKIDYTISVKGLADALHFINQQRTKIHDWHLPDELLSLMDAEAIKLDLIIAGSTYGDSLTTFLKQKISSDEDFPIYLFSEVILLNLEDGKDTVLKPLAASYYDYFLKSRRNLIQSAPLELVNTIKLASGVKISETLLGKNRLEYKLHIRNKFNDYAIQEIPNLYKKLIDFSTSKFGSYSFQVYEDKMEYSKFLMDNYCCLVPPDSKSYDSIANISNLLIDIFRERPTFLQNQLIGFNENETIEFMNGIRKDKNNILIYITSFQGKRDTQLELAFENELFSKSLLLNFNLKLQSAIIESNDADMIDSWKRIRYLNKEISKSLTQIPQESVQNNVVSYQNEIDVIFPKLKSNIIEGEVPGYELLQKVTWEDINQNIVQGEVAIEFAHFIEGEDKCIGDTIYCALLMKPGRDFNKIRYVRLFTMQEYREHDNYAKTKFTHDIDSLTAIGKSNIAIARYKSNNLKNVIKSKYQYDPNISLYSLIWEPIEKELSAIDTIIYYAPSGVLHNIAFNGIEQPIIDHSNTAQYLCDDYSLRRVTSTREIINIKNEKSNFQEIDDLLVIQNINYNSQDTSKPVVQPNTYAIKAGESFDCLVNPNSKIDWDYYPSDSATNELLEMFESAHYVSLKGVKATKQNVINNLNGEKYDVVSFFTHGFYNNCDQLDKFNSSGVQYSGKLGYIDPGIKNGLVFAGVNDTINKNHDCIILGNEVSALDMNGTHLTVLAACESGLGDINGSEGVFGLLRAFKMAGSDYILNSLWKVEVDRCSNPFIREFYNQYFNNYPNDIYRAYHETVKVRRKANPNPYFWAPYELVR